MKQVLIRSGEIVIDEVPAPEALPGTALVRVRASCISAGTEAAHVRGSGEPLWRKALKNPDKVAKVLRAVAADGLARTRDRVEAKLHAADATGYSAAGVVLEPGRGLEDLAPGQRVACAGAQCAHHAELIAVPRNLLVPVPDAVGDDDAATVTLGAIALHGVRRAEPTLGETFAVVGLGLLGQLTQQMLAAAGCRVIGLDPDAARVATARAHGMDASIDPMPTDDQVLAAARLTGGHGVDGVIVTAATPSHEVISLAFRMCRRKGRVVLVGDVGLNLDRADFYSREIDLRISASYGPGRYDPAYEERGLEYPIGYVRWTENRNMAEYLRMVGEGRVRLGGLPRARFPLDRAADAYAATRAAEARPLVVTLGYSHDAPSPARRRDVPRSARPVPGTIGVSVVGAGAFAQGTHLPNIRARADLFELRGVMSRRGVTAANAAREFGAAFAATSVDEALADERTTLVVVATRHDLHADLLRRCLAAGKSVLLEKPLCLTRDEHERVDAAVRALPADGPVVLVGYNRRFAPIAQRARAILASIGGPCVINYRMNAGYLPPDHWTHGPEGGGRNIGEACHVYDLFTMLTQARVRSVDARAITPAAEGVRRDDNFVATLTFDDGSVATLTYTAMGTPRHPKERMDVYAAGTVLSMDDWRSLTSVGVKEDSVQHRLSDKGHAAELAALAATLRDGGAWPVPWWQQRQASAVALDVQDAINASVPR